MEGFLDRLGHNCIFITCFLTLTAYHVHLYLTSGATMFAGRSSRYKNLAKAVESKVAADNSWLTSDLSTLYSIDEELIPDPEIRRKFVLLDVDEETKEFIERSVEKSDWIFTQMWHNLAISVLKWFYTQTDINGYLQRGSMFVVSRNQVEKLFRQAGIPSGENIHENLVDLGAGDGRPTSAFSHFFRTIYATETSWSMRNELQLKGFQLLDIDGWQNPGKYDAVSCLNLLDRMETPLTLIRDIKSSLKPGGVLIVALVLPFRPYVEFGMKGRNHRPVEELGFDQNARNFEDHVAPVVDVFDREGFDLKCWSRVPYLCEGDMSYSIYQLNDAIFIFQPK